MIETPTQASIDRTAALYFFPPIEGFWRWSDAGDAAEWADDGTVIAFYEEIETVLRALSDRGRGIPPFGAVLLFIAACRDSWGTGISRCASLWSYRSTLDTEVVDEQLNPNWTDELTKNFSKIHRLPKDLRQTVQAKADLATHFFEPPVAGYDSGSAPDIVNAFGQSLVPRLFARDAPEQNSFLELTSSQSKGIATARFIATVHALQVAFFHFSKVSEKAIRNRLATGLDSPPSPAPLDTEDARPLIDQLQNDSDPDLRLLGEIAHQLAAAVHLPKPPSAPDDLPLGGFSDISNRGSLDRLLISELALDDLSLSIRIAMNEALYLRRESPPKAPARHRVILIDNGIRLWGIPRVFATAVALAFADNTGEDGHVECFAPDSGSSNPHPVDLTDRKDLIAHLGTLTPHIHPAVSWEALLEQFPEKENENADFILITHPQSADDHGFVAGCKHFCDRHYHLATVDTSGAYSLWRCSPSGRQKIASAEIDLDEILAGDGAKARKLRDESNADLPIFYRLDQAPLRIAYPAASTLYLAGRIATRAHFPHFVAAPRDGRLLYWDRPDRGARLLSAFAPADDLLWLGIDPVHSTDSDPRWVGQLQVHQSAPGKNSTAILEITQITNAGQTVARFVAEFDTSLGPPIHTHHTADHLALFWQRQTDVISLKDGGLLSRREHSHDLVRGYGPYIEFDGENWFRYTHSPQGIYFERPSSNPSPLAAVWNIPGTEEPWAIAASGPPAPIDEIRSSAPAGHAPVFVSADGRRVVSGRSGTRTAYEMQSGQFNLIPARGDFLKIIEPTIAASADGTPTVRRQFNAIAATASGSFYLRSKRGTFSRINSMEKRLFLQNSTRPNHSNIIPFETLHHVPDHLAGLDLKVATWPEGTRAYLDRNAFLHLCPADTTRPEITLVLLAEGNIPYWSSDEPFEEPHPFFGGSSESQHILPHLQAIAQSAATQS